MFKRISIILAGLILLCVIALYTVLSLSQADLNQQLTAPVNAAVTLHRDARGHTIVNASSRTDAAYATGFAHAQDRLFQMDLLRRSAAGEIAEVFGAAALPLDKKARFHQFRQRAKGIYESLSGEHKAILDAYTVGVNNAVAQYTVLPFEYQLLRQDFREWVPEDSLLASFSMYMDLQHSQVDRDLALTRIAHHYGQAMVDFILLPSAYQAALDGSVLPQPQLIDIPELRKDEDFIDEQAIAVIDIPEPIDIGSNNWVVGGAITSNGKPLLSDDMHLGLRVPPIWYRLSLSYQHDGRDVKLHGVSLPGTPGIIVGSNMHIAWGFTNANLDNTDWILLEEDTLTTTVRETLKTPDGEQDFSIELSEFGPVKTLGEQRYALSWVAHRDYAVNLAFTELDSATNVEQARTIASGMGIPVQNMVVADTQGNVAWLPAGAVTARPTPSNQAIAQADYSELWSQRETQLPAVINPENHRIWTANARVVSDEQLQRFGDGGYAVGARGLQIRDRLFEKAQFTQQDFYDIQLDNDAQFLSRWHALLSNALYQSPSEFASDIALLNNWKACACPESVGYALTRRFRSQVINALLAPIEKTLDQDGISLRPVLRHVEPGIQQIIQQQALEWLPEDTETMNEFLMQQYRLSRQKMLDKFVDGELARLDELTWGTVNALHVQHPFSRVMPWLSGFLDLPKVPGFGDSYLPAVQNGTHGASQRFIIQPGLEENAILTIPGGQSGHPLSQFYQLGFDDYIANESTPLLPGEPHYTIAFSPQ